MKIACGILFILGVGAVVAFPTTDSGPGSDDDYGPGPDAPPHRTDFDEGYSTTEPPVTTTLSDEDYFRKHFPRQCLANGKYVDRGAKWIEGCETCFCGQGVDSVYKKCYDLDDCSTSQDPPGCTIGGKHYVANYAFMFGYDYCMCKEEDYGFDYQCSSDGYIFHIDYYSRGDGSCKYNDKVYEEHSNWVDGCNNCECRKSVSYCEQTCSIAGRKLIPMVLPTLVPEIMFTPPPEIPTTEFGFPSTTMFVPPPVTGFDKPPAITGMVPPSVTGFDKPPAITGMVPPSVTGFDMFPSTTMFQFPTSTGFHETPAPTKGPTPETDMD